MGIFSFGNKKKQKLAELQSILMPDSSFDKLLSEKELMQLTNQTINNDIRILAESEKIIKKTKDIDTFKYRMKLIDECMERMKKILPYVKTSVSHSELVSAYERDKIASEWDFKDRIRKEIQKYSEPYYQSIEKIESAWSVLQTFKMYSGDNAKSLERMCKQSIKLFEKYVDKIHELNLDYEIPKYVPGFVRLTMLYEKQENYQKAIEVCVQAIQIGAYDDHSKGKMYGRLARNIKKSGIKPDENMLKFIEQN